MDWHLGRSLSPSHHQPVPDWWQQWSPTHHPISPPVKVSLLPFPSHFFCYYKTYIIIFFHEYLQSKKRRVVQLTVVGLISKGLRVVFSKFHGVGSPQHISLGIPSTLSSTIIPTEQKARILYIRKRKEEMQSMHRMSTVGKRHITGWRWQWWQIKVWAHCDPAPACRAQQDDPVRYLPGSLIDPCLEPTW